MIEFDVDMGYLLEAGELDSVILNDENGKHEPITFWPDRWECKIIGSSTNNLMYPDYMIKWYELSCGHSVTLKGSEPPNFCPNCGRKVKR